MLVLNGDSISSTLSTSSVPAGYEGFVFTDVSFANGAVIAAQSGGLGYRNGATSPPNMFFNGNSASNSAPSASSVGSLTPLSGSFEFISAQVTTAFRGRATATLTFTFANATQLVTQVLTTYRAPTLVTALSLGVSPTASFMSLSFVDLGQAQGSQVVLDDITLCLSSQS